MKQSEICRKAGSTTQCSKRPKRFFSFDEQRILVQSFIYSNFDFYCPLVWHFSSTNSLQKIEKLQERAIKFLYNDELSAYGDLLSKSGRCTMHAFRLIIIIIITNLFTVGKKRSSKIN